VFPDAGHLIHMATHIDVLVGDYESCVRYNDLAISASTKAMQHNSAMTGTPSFYFGYIVHNYHMLVYGAMLGGMENAAMDCATKLNTVFLTEDMFRNNPKQIAYLESYAALDVHVMVRFGRWNEILNLKICSDTDMMLYRAATIHYARSLALASLGDVKRAKEEANIFEKIRTKPAAKERILHNNLVSDLLAVDSPMVQGEIAYREGDFIKSFALLRESVKLQDSLHYDEPWGKMQPVRHALGGLLVEVGEFEEAENVFRKDLEFHPNNPWSLTGLLKCLEIEMLSEKNGEHVNNLKKSTETVSILRLEVERISSVLKELRKSKLVDFYTEYACACCGQSIN